jgi:hypothetical protein
MWKNFTYHVCENSHIVLKSCSCDLIVLCDFELQRLNMVAPSTTFSVVWEVFSPVVSPTLWSSHWIWSSAASKQTQKSTNLLSMDSG